MPGPRRRMRRRRLVGAAATGAVVAGTATAVNRGMTNRQNQRDAAADEEAYQEQAVADSQAQIQQMQAEMDALKAQQAAPASAAGGNDLMSEIEKLAEMNSAGVLTDEEFAAAKAKLLG